MSTWRDQGECVGEEQSRWFDPVEEQLDEVGIAYARSRCFDCPVRFECFESAMGWEDGSAEQYRFGIWGGMTPQQRASLWRRGEASWKCAGCGQVYDPTALMRGLAVCGCSSQVTAPISDAGDQWAERHTRLAQTVIEWVTTLETDAEVPSPTAYAREHGIRKDDVIRVYRALVEDGIIVRVGLGQYRRNRAAGALRARGRVTGG